MIYSSLDPFSLNGDILRCPNLPSLHHFLKMDVGFAGSAPLCIIDKTYNFEGVEIIVDSSSNSDSQSQDVLSNEGCSENMVYGLDIKFEEESSPDDPGASANSGPPINNQDDDVQVYLPAGVILQPLAVPNNEIALALQNTENGTVEFYPINNDTLSKYRSSLLDENENSGNAYLPFYHVSYTKNPFSNNQLLGLVYNTPETADTYTPDSPEYIGVNHIIPKSSDNAVLSDVTNITDKVSNLSFRNNQDDEDVIFVREYIEVRSSGNKPETTAASKITDENTVPLSSPLPAASIVRRRKRRRTFGEKRKNPIRKAQIDKVSADLIEKLSIPSSVFNARVRKNRQEASTHGTQKNLRQSCRTTGAILRPPSPLNQTDFKEWPTEGMHERPIYNQETGTVQKHDYDPVATIKHKKKPISSPDGHNQPQAMRRTQNFKEKQNSERFIRLTHERFHMMLSYAEEVNEFNKMIASNADSTLELKESLYETSSPTSTSKDKKIAKKFSQMIQGKKSKKVLNVADMLANACTLYGLANGTSEKAVANYITSLSVSEGKNWLRKQM